MPPIRERLRVRPSAPASLLLAVLVGVIAVCVILMQRTIVAFDDWNFVLDRRGSRVSFIPNQVDQWIKPHNGHPVMILVAIYRVVGAVAHYSYPLLVGIAAFVHGVFAWTVFVYARRRIGAWPALVPALLVALLGRGAPVILSPIVMAFTLALAAGVGSLNLIDGQHERRADKDPSQPDDPWVPVAALGLFAVCSSGLGVARLATLGVDRVIRTQTKAARLRWIMAIGGPALAFAVWYVSKRDIDRNASGLSDSISFAWRVLANGAAGLLGFGGRATTLAAAAILLSILTTAIRRWNSIDRVRVLALAAGLVVDVGLVAWSRAGNALPASGRYTYVFGAQVCLIAVEALRGWRASPSQRRPIGAVAGIAVVAAIGAGIRPFMDIANEYRRDNHRTVVSLSAFLRAQSNGATFAPDLHPDPEFAPQVDVQRLNALVADGQSPVGIHVPTARTEPERALTDRFDAAAFIRPAPPSDGTNDPGAFDFSGEPPIVVNSSNVRLETRGSCTTVASTGPDAFVDVQAPDAGIAWRIEAQNRGTVTVRARHLAEDYAGQPVFVSTPNGAATATIPSSTQMQDGRPWVVRLQPSATVRLCKDSGA